MTTKKPIRPIRNCLDIDYTTVALMLFAAWIDYVPQKDLTPLQIKRCKRLEASGLFSHKTFEHNSKNWCFSEPVQAMIDSVFEDRDWKADYLDHVKQYPETEIDY